MHLANATSETLAHVIAVLKGDFDRKIPTFYPNHCTGERAYQVLTQAFGEQVQPCPAGMILNFE